MKVDIDVGLDEKDNATPNKLDKGQKGDDRTIKHEGPWANGSVHDVGVNIEEIDDTILRQYLFCVLVFSILVDFVMLL